MSETLTMTLADFLLARIAEDEDAAANASHHSQMVHDYERDNYGHLWVKTTRVLADCESKRRIVERCAAVDYAMPSTHLAHGILAELALPYADHEDYRSEWAP